MNGTANIAGAFGEQLATDKTEVPGGHRWTVTGQHGTVTYDNHGNRIGLYFADGDIDSMGDRWADRVGEYAALGDDDAVYEVLADHYRTMLAGDPLVASMVSAGTVGWQR